MSVRPLSRACFSLRRCISGVLLQLFTSKGILSLSMRPLGYFVLLERKAALFCSPFTSRSSPELRDMSAQKVQPFVYHFYFRFRFRVSQHMWLSGLLSWTSFRLHRCSNSILPVSIPSRHALGLSPQLFVGDSLWYVRISVSPISPVFGAPPVPRYFKSDQHIAFYQWTKWF